MSNDKKVSRRIFEEVWNDKNIAVLDELIAADYVHDDPQSPKFSDGIEGYKQLVAHYFNAFPDARFTIVQEIQEGDTAETRWRVQGTHKGDLPMLPATNKSFSVAGATIARLKDGKIVEGWNIWDALGLMQQLGGVSIAAHRAA